MGKKRKRRSYDVDDFTEVGMENLSYPTWGHIDPCAIIVDLISKEQIAMTPDIEQTLDCNGFLTPDGKPDVEYAESIITKYRESRSHV